MRIAIPGHFCHIPWDKIRILTARSPLQHQKHLSVHPGLWQTADEALVAGCAYFRCVFPALPLGRGTVSREVPWEKGVDHLLRGNWAVQGKTWQCCREGSSKAVRDMGLAGRLLSGTEISCHVTGDKNNLPRDRRGLYRVCLNQKSTELAEMKAESISPAEGRERVAYKPFISVISSLAAEFSLNKMLTIMACFLIAPGL